MYSDLQIVSPEGQFSCNFFTKVLKVQDFRWAPLLHDCTFTVHPYCGSADSIFIFPRGPSENLFLVRKQRRRKKTWNKRPWPGSNRGMPPGYSNNWGGPCQSAMTAVCEEHKFQRSDDNFRPVQIGISVLWDCIFISQHLFSAVG